MNVLSRTVPGYLWSVAVNEDHEVTSIERLGLAQPGAKPAYVPSSCGTITHYVVASSYADAATKALSRWIERPVDSEARAACS